MSAETFDLLRAKCAEYAKRRARLLAGVAEMKQKMNAVRSIHEPHLLQEIREADALREDIRATTAANKLLFKSPKSHVFHGIKIGFQKSADAFEIADQDKTLELIKTICKPAERKLLITTKESIKKAALKGLDKATLKSLKVKFVEGGDETIVNAQDDALEKLSVTVWGDK